MRGNTIALRLKLATRCRITRLGRRRTENKLQLSSLFRRAITIWSISSRAPWLLSVTGSFALPSEPKGGHMPDSEFGLREWIALKVLTPVLPVLLVAAAMIIQW